MNKKSAQKSRQYCERPIDSVKLIPRKVRKSSMPRYYLFYVETIHLDKKHEPFWYIRLTRHMESNSAQW